MNFSSAYHPGLIIVIAVLPMVVTGCSPLDGTSDEPGELVANAGEDQTAVVGQTVVLSGSATGGTPPYIFTWVQTSGPAHDLTAADGATPSLQAVVQGTCVFSMTVTDTTGDMSTDDVSVVIQTQGGVNNDLASVEGNPDAEGFLLLTEGKPIVLSAPLPAGASKETCTATWQVDGSGKLVSLPDLQAEYTPEASDTVLSVTLTCGGSSQTFTQDMAAKPATK